MNFHRLLPTACAVAFLAAAAPASAADWAPAGTITPPELGSVYLDGAIDAAGNALFTWDDGPTGGPVRYRTRPAGGPFGDIATIPANAGSMPDVSHSTANGDAVAAWVERQDEQAFNYRFLKASIRQGSGAYGAPQTIFDAGANGFICWEQTATAGSGESILVFGVGSGQPNGDSCPAFVAVRAPGAGSFGTPTPLPGPPADYRPEIALDAAGNGLIAWRGQRLTAVQVARYTAGGTVSPPQAVAVPGETVPRFEGPVVLRVSRPTGRALIGFPSSANGGDTVHVGAATGTVTTGFSQPHVLSGPADLSSGQLGSYFDGDAGDDGTLALAWRSSGRGKTRAQAAYVGPDDEGLTARRTVSVSGYSVQTPRVVVTLQGRVTVAWLRLTGSARRALEAASADGGRFSRPQRVSSSNVVARPQPVLELNSRGDQFLVWSSDIKGFHSHVDSAKASSRTGRFSRVINVLRTRTNALPRTSELVGDFVVLPGPNGAMFTAVRRDESSSRFWDLRSYGAK
jgi:hypothetical protein